MKNQQLEIRLRSKPCLRSTVRRQRRASRARWWFSQMRRVVDEAIEWSPAPAARPQQPALPLAPVR